MLTKLFFYYLQFCFGGWFSVSRKLVFWTPGNGTQPNAAPSLRFLFHLSYLFGMWEGDDCAERLGWWVDGWVVRWWAFGLCRTEGAWESRWCLRPEMEEIIEHLLGNQATTAPFLFPNLVRKTSSNPTPHQLCLIPFIQIPIPFLRNTLPKWGIFP